MGRSKAPSLPIKALSFCRPTELRGWQRNWIHRGAPRPANPVTRFPPGKVVAPATKGGMHFLARRAVVWFSNGRKPGCPVFAAKGGIKKWRPKGRPHRQRSDTIYLPRAEPSTRPGGVSRSRTEPWQPRAERPGDWLNPHARKGVSTFGNTGKHRTAPVPVPIPTAPQAPDALSPSPQQAGKQVIEGGKALRSGRRGEIDTLLS